MQQRQKQNNAAVRAALQAGETLALRRDETPRCVKLKATASTGLMFWKRRFPRYIGAGVLALALIHCVVLPAKGQPNTPPKWGRSGDIPASEFSRLIRELSEPAGDFATDNLTSNERLYLHALGKLKELKVSGGAYIGVGPEQNFTYIAKVRPRIAFIVDIRRAAVIQHLMYKAIFHLARNRAEFLSWLFGKPLSGTGSEDTLSLEALLQYIRDAPGARETMLTNLVTIRKTIEEDFQFPLSADDDRDLEYIYTTFWRDNLAVGFRFGHHLNIGAALFPSFAELILATGQDGQRGNFLAAEADFQFVRMLQEQNRIIPVVGDFAGTKALAAVARYLRGNGYKVSAFYTSNVEEYLYENKVFGRFAENVCRLPVSRRSVIIRAVRARWAPHSFWSPQDRITPFLQKIRTFCEDYKKDLFPDYFSLVTTHYVSTKEPLDQALPKPAP